MLLTIEVPSVICWQTEKGKAVLPDNKDKGFSLVEITNILNATNFGVVVLRHPHLVGEKLFMIYDHDAIEKGMPINPKASIVVKVMLERDILLFGDVLICQRYEGGQNE